MNEFVTKGYDNASTNEIIKAAGISKGLLFHYFNSKKDLFLFLYDYSIELYVNEFFKKINLNERDVFKRIRDMVLTKWELVKKNPEMFNFIKTAYFEEAAEIKQELENFNKKNILQSIEKLFENIEHSYFKEGVDIKKAIDIILWTLDGFAARIQQGIKNLPVEQIDYAEGLEELDKYLELLKDSFYK